MDETQDHQRPPSLLWPLNHDRQTHSQALTEQQALDLGLGGLVGELDVDGRHARQVRAILMAVNADPAVIEYRQAVLRVLLDDAGLCDRLAALLPDLAELGHPRSAAWAQDSPLLLVPPRLSDLELYVSCVQKLHDILAEPAARGAPALTDLHGFLVRTLADPQFQSLAAELPALRSQLDNVASVTVGVNLDRDLRPVAATLVAINSEPFVGPRSMAQRLFGRPPAGTQSMTALRHVAERGGDSDPLARDLEKVLAEVVQPVAAGLERYSRIHARPLAAIEGELAFFLGVVGWVRRLADHGYRTCLPRVSSLEHQLDGAYNPVLAAQLLRGAGKNGAALPAMVPNPIDFQLGRIVFLTGPNRGGKTTYLRAVGLNQILFQAGAAVAAADGRMVPVDTILTHFPLVEGETPGSGRLDDEARRIRDMFDRASTMSLLLFNEPLTSTSEREAQRLASDVLRALQVLGARTVYVTHLHALAAELADLNQDGTVAQIVSWVAQVGDDAMRTYEIRPGTPRISSHAATIAAQHGITFEQLAQRLAERGIGTLNDRVSTPAHGV